MGEDGEKGKKKEKEVIGWLKVGVSCHFSSGEGDLIRTTLWAIWALQFFFKNSC